MILNNRRVAIVATSSRVVWATAWSHRVTTALSLATWAQPRCASLLEMMTLNTVATLDHTAGDKQIDGGPIRPCDGVPLASAEVQHVDPAHPGIPDGNELEHGLEVEVYEEEDQVWHGDDYPCHHLDLGRWLRCGLVHPDR